jgi:SAM-dependent methyltransferase
MLVPDPALATSEIRRVLRRGGRAAVAVWGPRASNPWLGRLFDAVSAQVGHPVPPPGIPGPFSLAESGALGRILAGAGLSGVEVSELPLPYRVAAFDDLWRRTTAIAGPVATILASLPPPAVTAVRSRFHEAMRRYETATGLNVPGLTLIASGHRDG